MGHLTDVVGGRVFKLGSSGPAVQSIQLALAQIGYKLKGTSWFGPATDTAVTDFQRRNGLDPDGEFGGKSAKMLDGILAGKSPLPHETDPHIGMPLWVIYGLTLINTHEVAGKKNNPDIMEWAKEEGGGIAASFPNDEVPWCALFANHILTKQGLKGTETLWALDWDSDKKWPNKKLAGPAVGAFMPMKRPGGGHITVVVGRDQRGNIMGLGGNQSNAVNIKPFPVSRALSFRYPAGVSPPGKVGFEHLPIINSDGVITSKLD